MREGLDEAASASAAGVESWLIVARRRVSRATIASSCTGRSEFLVSL